MTWHSIKFRAVGLLLAAIFLCCREGHADFYRYLDDNGVETFTNTPTNKKATKVLREARPKREESFATQEPLLPVKGTITSTIGWRHDPIDGALKHHNGVDIAVPTGTPVKAIAPGTVTYSAPRGGYGNLVAIEHDDGSRSLYGHNSHLTVRAGDRVEAGQVVALSGSTGHSTGPHLHFELWRNGANVTQAYLKTGAGLPEIAGSVRSYLQSDGSVVITNLKD